MQCHCFAAALTGHHHADTQDRVFVGGRDRAMASQLALPGSIGWHGWLQMTLLITRCSRSGVCRWGVEMPNAFYAWSVDAGGARQHAVCMHG